MASCEAALRAASQACALPDPVTVASTCGAIVAETVPIGGFCQAGKDGLPCADGAGRCRGGAKGALCTTVVMQDGACSSDADCSPGLYCLPASAGTAPSTAAPGTCGKARGAGAACTASAHCVAGTSCAANGQCASGAPLGASCALPGQCGPSLVCDTDNGVCIAQIDAGEACLGDPHCKAGLRCVGKRLIGTCGERAPAGAACADHAECATGLRCDETNQTCVPALAVGAACKSAGSCGQGLGCDATGWTCKILPAKGESCLMGVESCATGLVCLDYAKGKGSCEPPGQAGSDCVKHNNCAAGLGCDFGTPGPSGKGGSCVAAPANGKACMDGFICAAGYCSHADGKTVCRPFVAVDGLCPGGNECGPGKACVPDGGNVLRCVALPAAGEACLFVCAGDSVCRRKIEPGVCEAAACVR
ncbi:MAG: hypothetical protein H6747_16465 [Deltaproteobacteria bacterium]|nr:hypothetical protein [Deltaproteobacteria bacterium]